MELYKLTEDIDVFYITAKSFPEGIVDAHKKLHALFPSAASRKFFGISFPDRKGVIAYKAATQSEYPGESNTYRCESYIIRKGEYTSILIHNYQNDNLSIDRAFKKLLTDPDIDPLGACVEMYLGEKDVRCMIRLSK
jgi:hypothetical protein